MNKFKVPIGDWSDDGHGKCDIFTVEANYTVGELQQAYKDSCKLTGISFNHGDDFTGLNLPWNHPESDDRHIATEYEDYSISKLASTILLEHGIDVWKGFNKDAFKERENAPIDGSENLLDLIMKFINLSIPSKDLEYKIVGDDLPYLNGFWNPNLNVQFGYGLFS